VRQSRHLVLYWRSGRLIVHNYATGTRTKGSAVLAALLDFCLVWRTERAIAAALGFDDLARVRALVRRLVDRALLERAGAPADPRVRAMDAFAAWNPEAGFFHTATKDVRYWSPDEARRRTRQRAASAPMPAPIKRYRGHAVVLLPPPAGGAFPKVLQDRRTWRRFAGAALTLDEVGTLLGLSVGIQHWMTAGGPEFPLKTSPSGGSRHPIECYVVARNVDGLRPGIYHYAADRHAVERLGNLPGPRRLASYYPSSRHFAKAGLQVFFSAVFARQLWRYPYSRAYRAALIEAGHVCQTFCLTAAWLGLAPFSVMGLAEPTIERDLGLDGILESVLYAAGAGRKPKGVAWAPLGPGTHAKLSIRPNRRLSP
jgi:SagB-type dehydrogenase family enzyme